MFGMFGAMPFGTSTAPFGTAGQQGSGMMPFPPPSPPTGGTPMGGLLSLLQGQRPMGLLQQMPGSGSGGSLSGVPGGGLLGATLGASQGQGPGAGGGFMGGLQNFAAQRPNSLLGMGLNATNPLRGMFGGY